MGESPDKEPQAGDATERSDAARDLRYTEHQEGDVRVTRDLSGPSMFLAVGSRTHFHEVKFSLRPRAPEPQRGAPVTPPDAAEVAPDVAEAPASDDASTGASTPDRSGMLARVRGWLGM